MAMRTNQNRKADTKANTNETSTALIVPMIKKNAGNSKLLETIDAAIAGARNVVQSILKVEPLIQEAALGCLKHCHTSKDAKPADRLIKGLLDIKHPAANAMAGEVVAWFRMNSPIRWDAKRHVYVAKETNPDGSPNKDYKPFDEANAEETSFDKTPQAQRARGAAQRAHKQALKPVDMPMVIARAKGIINFVNNAITGKDERPIKDGEMSGIKKFTDELNTVLKNFGGEQAVVPLAKPAKAEAKKKAA